MGRPSKEVTERTVPEWERQASQQAQAMTSGAANIGFIPYYGPSVAGLSQGEQAYMQQTGDLASAFGMQGPAGPPMISAKELYDGNIPEGLRQGMPMSSGDIYDRAIKELYMRNPTQYRAIQGLLPNMLPKMEPAQTGMGGMSDKEMGLMGSLTPKPRMGSISERERGMSRRIAPRGLGRY